MRRSYSRLRSLETITFANRSASPRFPRELRSCGGSKADGSDGGDTKVVSDSEPKVGKIGSWDSKVGESRELKVGKSKFAIE